MGSSNASFSFTVKERLALIGGTALALASFAPSDPYVSIPMLIVSGLVFVVLCIRNEGNVLIRSLAAGAIVVTLSWIGWRALRSSDQGSVKPATVVTQTSNGSDCSNIAGGGNVTVNCGDKGKNNDKKHAPAH